MTSVNKTIFYIGNFEMPDKNAAAHRVLSIGKILRKLGYDVVFLGTSYSNEPKGSVSLQSFEGFHYMNLPYPKGKKQWVRNMFSIKKYANIIDSYSNVAGIISYNQPAWVIRNLTRYSKKNNMFILADCTEWFSGVFKTNLILDIIKTIDNYLKMFVYIPQTHGVIAVSKYLNNHFKSKCHTIEIPPLVDMSESKWSKEFTSENEVPVLVYAGSAFSVVYKDFIKDRLDLIIEALYILRTKFAFKLYIVGSTEKEYLDFFTNHATILQQLGSSVKFLGKIQNQAAIDNVKKADFTVLVRDETTLTRAGFPTKFVESIAAGTPVIANDNSNVWDYIKEGENGFKLHSKDPQILSEIFSQAFALNKSERQMLKEKTAATNPFHYENYLSELRMFLETTITK